MKPFLPGAEVIRCNFFTMPDPAQVDRAVLARANDHVFSRVRGTAHVASPYIIMSDTEETIGQLVAQPQAVAIKCYCYGKDAPKHGNLAIGEFLPEAAWVVSQQTGKPIILHMQKDRALSDPENLHYIQTMCRRYPDAKLILAHCARGFAAWTVLESIRSLAGLENVWYDFAAVCEDSPMAACIMQTAGKRVLWGSDYPICMHRGRAVSWGMGYSWILDELLPDGEGCILAAENLLAFRRAASLLDLDATQVQDIFYNNAAELFRLEG
jgi:glutamate-1-semialdehyde 2,1-aminomutase